MSFALVDLGSPHPTLNMLQDMVLWWLKKISGVYIKSLAFLMAPQVSSQYVYPSSTEGQIPLDPTSESAAQWTVVSSELEGDLGSRCQEHMLQRLMGDLSGSPANLP
jgi:hypothetical protein